MSDIAFSKMVMKLAADIRALDNQVGRSGRDVVRKKLNTARALSDVLWTKMGADGIDPLKYREILIDIEYGLENIQVSLDRQSSTLWERIIDVFMSALEFWADLFRLNLPPRLGSRAAPLALPFHDEKPAKEQRKQPKARKRKKRPAKKAA